MAEYVLYIKSRNPECAEAVKLLRKANVKFKVIDIDVNGIKGFMWKDVGSPNDVPFLVSENFIASGLESIKKIIGNLKR
ncbi:MAG: hypothetical protein B6U69_02820 [Thermofilum sp. ex4484_15]|nr:MAG: hypothetical protein B6U69_02820 [Thermofilum sp. ex4484_15]